MFATYTAKYTKITTGYMGQLVEWPEIVTEGGDIENCQDMLRDALNEMILAYQHQGKKFPLKEHRNLDRITVNELCKQAQLRPKYLYAPQRQLKLVIMRPMCNFSISPGSQ